MSTQQHMFLSLYSFCGHSTWEPPSIVCDDEQGDLFYSGGPHRNPNQPQLTQEKLGRDLVKNEDGRTGKVEFRQAEITSSWRSRQRYILTYSKVLKENLWALSFQQVGHQFLRPQYPTSGRVKRRRTRTAQATTRDDTIIFNCGFRKRNETWGETISESKEVEGTPFCNSALQCYLQPGYRSDVSL